jgi:uncharacterized protein YndB with AHSA1/START domain
VIERTYAASPARVFKAWAEPKAKARWFADPDEREAKYELDFRVGGREINGGGPPGGPAHTYDARYQDIVADERIVYTYDMHLDDKRISVSLATVEFKLAGAGTRLIFTEQAVFLDGLDNPADREHGTRALLDKLDAALRREPAKETKGARERAGRGAQRRSLPRGLRGGPGGAGAHRHLADDGRRLRPGEVCLRGRGRGHARRGVPKAVPGLGGDDPGRRESGSRRGWSRVGRRLRLPVPAARTGGRSSLRRRGGRGGRDRDRQERRRDPRALRPEAERLFDEHLAAINDGVGVPCSREVERTSWLAFAVNPFPELFKAGPGDALVKVKDAFLRKRFTDRQIEVAQALAWVRAFYRDLFSDTGGVPVPGEVRDGAMINHPDVDLADPGWNTSGVPWHTLYYKANYARLQQVKSRWDPRNVFHHALSIRPA